MTLLIAAPTRNTDDLVACLEAQEPALDIRVWPDTGDPADVEFAVLWKQPKGLLEALPGLRAVTSLGAGVDSILSDPGLPGHLPVGRLVGPRLAANMAAYITAMVTLHWRDLPGFIADQKTGRWNQWAPEHPPVVGLLGMGEMAHRTARALMALEHPVEAWSLSGQGPKSVTMHSGPSGLQALAGRADVLVCLLPLTHRTRGILNGSLFSAMKPGACLINVGRGEHLVDDDLLDALAAGRPHRAILDVFRTEPLPRDHPFWNHPGILMTPHCASITLTEEAAALALTSYHRVRNGQPPLGAVDRSRGY